jgi:hypothetical protein
MEIHVSFMNVTHEHKFEYSCLATVSPLRKKNFSKSLRVSKLQKYAGDVNDSLPDRKWLLFSHGEECTKLKLNSFSNE